MKKVGLIVSIILLTGVITFTLLKHRSSSNVQLVRFKGLENVTNLTKGYLDWQSINHSTDRLNGIPAQENDIIFGSSTENDEDFLVIQNKKPSDKVWNVRTDSLGAYVDERLATLFLGDNGNAVSKWLSHSTKEDLRHLQSIYISDTLTENNIQELKKIGKYTSGLGLMIDIESNDMDELLEALNPSWLWFIGVNISPEGLASLNRMDQLESLILSDANVKELTFDGLKKLQMLQIVNPDTIIPEKLNKLPPKLRGLQITNAEIANLNFLQDNTQLRELSFNYCYSLSNISALEKLPDLHALSLANCDSIPDLTPLNGLKKLKWFAPPKNISEQQLASMINTSPNLQSLVLVDCQNIKSLHLLKDSHKLAFLTLISTPIAPDSLIRFKNLKYLAYGNETSNDSLSLARLQKEMPDTLVTAAEPFCMGTGWLIVFFAVLIVLTMVGIKLRNSIRA